MCSKCSVNFKMHVVCSADRDKQEVSTKNFIVSDPDSTVIPVQYERDDGTEDDPIRLMMLSKN